MKLLKLIFSQYFKILCVVLVSILSSSCSEPKTSMTSNFVDPYDISKISKFRSCCGHDFSGWGEKNRSMKTYLHPAPTFTASDNELPIYSPFDGKIIAIKDERHFLPCYDEIHGKQIHIEPSDDTRVTMRFFHANPLVAEGDTVYSGQHIGFADLRGCDLDNESIKSIEPYSFDVSLEIGIANHYVSIFDYLDESVLDEWLTRGLPSINDTFVSKADRDANPCTSWNEDQCAMDEVTF